MHIISNRSEPRKEWYFEAYIHTEQTLEEVPPDKLKKAKLHTGYSFSIKKEDMIRKIIERELYLNRKNVPPTCIRNFFYRPDKDQLVIKRAPLSFYRNYPTKTYQLKYNRLDPDTLEHIDSLVGLTI